MLSPLDSEQPEQGGQVPAVSVKGHDLLSTRSLPLPVARAAMGTQRAGFIHAEGGVPGVTEKEEKRDPGPWTGSRREPSSPGDRHVTED